MKLFNEKLECLGLKSLQEASKPIVAALVSEKPILFISDNPVAIATLSQKISWGIHEIESEVPQGLGVYDARKAEKRDLFGAAAESNSGVDADAEPGGIESIANKRFIFINDLANAPESMKTIWTDVLGPEKIEGHSTENLRHIIACMGEVKKKKNTLDPTLANAFGSIVPIPSDGALDFAGNISMSGILYWGKSPRHKLNLKELIAGVKKIQQNLPTEHKTLIRDYVTAFGKELEQKEIDLPEYKQTALAENMELFFAIDLYEGELTSAQIEQNLLMATQYSWIHFATSENPKLKVLKKAYTQATRGLIEITKISKRYFKELKQQYAKEDIPSFDAVDDDEEPGSFTEDVSGLVQALGAGAELFTVGFYEMVIKGNSDWKSKLDINN
jgi:hypothetical protein